MKCEQVTLITEYSESEKENIKAVGAIYLSSFKAWLVTGEQLLLLETGNIPEKKSATPSIIVDDYGNDWRLSGNGTFSKRDVIKALNGRKWDSVNKCWLIPKNKYTRQELEEILC